MKCISRSTPRSRRGCPMWQWLRAAASPWCSRITPIRPTSTCTSSGSTPRVTASRALRATPSSSTTTGPALSSIMSEWQRFPAATWRCGRTNAQATGTFAPRACPTDCPSANASYLVNDIDGSDQTSPSIAARRSENNPFICWEDVRVAAHRARCLRQSQSRGGGQLCRRRRTGCAAHRDRARPELPQPVQSCHRDLLCARRTSGQVDLVVYNALGQKVKTLYSGPQVAGAHKLSWNGTDDRGSQVASGTYFYRLSWDDGEVTRKMTLLR